MYVCTLILCKRSLPSHLWKTFYCITVYVHLLPQPNLWIFLFFFNQCMCAFFFPLVPKGLFTPKWDQIIVKMTSCHCKNDDLRKQKCFAMQSNKRFCEIKLLYFFFYNRHKSCGWNCIYLNSALWTVTSYTFLVSLQRCCLIDCY